MIEMRYVRRREESDQQCPWDESGPLPEAGTEVRKTSYYKRVLQYREGSPKWAGCWGPWTDVQEVEGED